jgi:hypothetical protein
LLRPAMEYCLDSDTDTTNFQYNQPIIKKQSLEFYSLKKNQILSNFVIETELFLTRLRRMLRLRLRRLNDMIRFTVEFVLSLLLFMPPFNPYLQGKNAMPCAAGFACPFDP